jgi:hypothetical protein
VILRVLALVLLASTPAGAQQVEIAPLIAYRTPGHIERTAAGIDALAIEDSLTWGAQVTWFVTDRLGLDAMWTRQPTGLTMANASGTAELFEMTSAMLHGNLLYRFGAANDATRPFVFGGFGATFLDASGGEDETKTSWDAGGGLAWFARPHLGVRAFARYAPTRLSDASSSTCNPFGFCQQTLHVFEVAVAAALRF